MKDVGYVPVELSPGWVCGKRLKSQKQTQSYNSYRWSGQCKLLVRTRIFISDVRPWLVAFLPKEPFETKKIQTPIRPTSPHASRRCPLKHHAMPEENTQPLAPISIWSTQREKRLLIKSPQQRLARCPLSVAVSHPPHLHHLPH